MARLSVGSVGGRTGEKHASAVKNRKRKKWRHGADIASIATYRPQVRQHVKVQAELAKKMLTRRKCKALFGKIDGARSLA